ncbi:hypothetical protein [Streptomyces collinus]|uniref:hypothetical protein n=1 Tax=Streptomyces collinus TaxID=42684 RepID=UPI0036E89384
MITAVQMGESALDNPSLGAKVGIVLGTRAGDMRLYARLSDQAAALVVVVAEVGHHHVWDQLGDVVAVATGQGLRRPECPWRRVLR